MKFKPEDFMGEMCDYCCSSSDTDIADNYTLGDL